MKHLQRPGEKICPNCELAEHNLMKTLLKKTFQRPLLIKQNV